MSETLRNVTPNLAELLVMLPDCTTEDIDEMVRFLKLLHRGRANLQLASAAVSGSGAASSQPVSGYGPVDRSTGRPPNFSGGFGGASGSGSASRHQGGPYGQRPSASSGGGTATSNATPNAGGGANYFLPPPPPPPPVHPGGGDRKNYKGRGDHHPPPKNPSAYSFHGRAICQSHIDAVVAKLERATSAAEAKTALQKCQDEPGLYPATFALFGRYCRNCYLTGMGWKHTPAHSVAECKLLGTRCMIECRNCKNGECHWIDDCPLRPGKVFYGTGGIATAGGAGGKNKNGSSSAGYGPMSATEQGKKQRTVDQDLQNRLSNPNSEDETAESALAAEMIGMNPFGGPIVGNGAVGG